MLKASVGDQAMTGIEKANEIDEETIKLLIDTFYSKIRNDNQLGPIFEQQIGGTDASWQPHLLNMYDFWSSIMLKTGRFRGNPMMKHLAIPRFDITLFDQWLLLFKETAYEIHNDAIAAIYTQRSTLIADSLRYALYDDFKPARKTA